MATLGLARSPFLESITVIDPNAGGVIARIQESFSDDFNAKTNWIPYVGRFDDDTPSGVTRDVFRGRP